MAFGKEWVDDGLEDGDEHQDQDGVEGLHLVGLDGHFTQPPVHPHGLQRPARALRRRGKGEEHSGISLSSVTILHDTIAPTSSAILHNGIVSSLHFAAANNDTAEWRLGMAIGLTFQLTRFSAPYP